MALEIVPGRYFIGFFYLDLPEKFEGGKIGPFGKGGNLQALIWKEGEEPPGDARHDWTMRYRFRYYRDSRIHDHEDQMNWFQAKHPQATEAEALEKAEAFITASAAVSNTKPHIWLIQGNSERCFERIKTDPPYWMHMKPLMGAEAEADPEFAKAIEPITKMNRAKPKILEGPMR